MASGSYLDDRLAALKGGTNNFTSTNLSPSYQPNVINAGNSYIIEHPPVQNSQYINTSQMNNSYLNNYATKKSNFLEPNYTANVDRSGYMGGRDPNYRSSYIDANISATLGDGYNNYKSGIWNNKYDNDLHGLSGLGNTSHDHVARNVGEKLHSEAEDKARVYEDCKDLESKFKFEHEKNVETERKYIEDMKE